MDQKRRHEIAEQLEEKADIIAYGFFGEDVDNESWAADCRRAAKRLRRGEELSATDVDEIESGTDADADEIDELTGAIHEREGK